MTRRETRTPAYEYKCDGCGVREHGASELPSGWWSLTVHVPSKSGGPDMLQPDLCPECMKRLSKFLRGWQ